MKNTKLPSNQSTKIDKNTQDDGWLVFYCMSTFASYLMLNPVFKKKKKWFESK